MKVEELKAKLTGAQEYTSTVSIDWVLSALEGLETTTPSGGLSPKLADLITREIERALNASSNDLVDLDSAEFEINYNNRVELNSVDVYVESIMDHITACLDEYVIEE